MPTQEFSRVSATWTKRLADKLEKKGYRDAYVASHVGRWIAYQVQTLREQRGWSQSELGERMGTSQSNICRIENPDYGRLSQQTLLQLASNFDVALVVMFVDYPTFLEQSRDVSPEAMAAEGFDRKALEPQVLELPVTEETRSAFAANINFESTGVQIGHLHTVHTGSRQRSVATGSAGTDAQIRVDAHG